MQRQTALVLTILFFAIFWLITYYGANITFWSSLIFSLFISLILLILFYPPSQATTDEADYTLILYGIVVVVGVILLAVYIAQRTLSDIRY